MFSNPDIIKIRYCKLKLPCCIPLQYFPLLKFNMINIPLTNIPSSSNCFYSLHSNSIKQFAFRILESAYGCSRVLETCPNPTAKGCSTNRCSINMIFIQFFWLWRNEGITINLSPFLQTQTLDPI